MSAEKSNWPGSAAASVGRVPPGRSSPCAAAGIERPLVDALIHARRTMGRGRTLFRGGDPFSDLYVVRDGQFKTRVVLEDGRDQVTGFHMAGDVLGLDAVAAGIHRSDAVALDDAEVGVLDFASLASLARRSPDVQRWLCRVMSQQIVQLQSTTAMLGRMRADERVASFLMNLAQRGAPQHPACATLELHMTRVELGSHLGLTLETVSRCFSKLHEQGIVHVHRRTIRLLDLDALSSVAQGRIPAGTLVRDDHEIA
jgi:CRP/FNR family transcriptional regulator, anaerobic regulatory protein